MLLLPGSLSNMVSISTGGEGLGLGPALYGGDVRAADGVGKEGGGGTEGWGITRNGTVAPGSNPIFVVPQHIT